MTINPYEPPQGPTSPRSLVDVADSGPWRDHHFLVMRVDHDCELPQRCVMTGVSVEPDQTYYCELRFAKSFSSVHNVTLEVNWPIVNAARPRTRFFPMAGIVVSIAILTLGVTMYHREATKLSLGLPYREVCIVGSVIAATCLIIDNLTAKPFLSIVRAEDGFAWISGAHVDFLNELPPWPGSETA